MAWTKKDKETRCDRDSKDGTIHSGQDRKRSSFSLQRLGEMLVSWKDGLAPVESWRVQSFRPSSLAAYCDFNTQKR